MEILLRVETESCTASASRCGSNEEGHGIVAAPVIVVDDSLYQGCDGRAFHIDLRLGRAPFGGCPGGTVRSLGAAGEIGRVCSEDGRVRAVLCRDAESYRAIVRGGWHEVDTGGGNDRALGDCDILEAQTSGAVRAFTACPGDFQARGDFRRCNGAVAKIPGVVIVTCTAQAHGDIANGVGGKGQALQFLELVLEVEGKLFPIQIRSD
ncbi:hypothetical protein D9M70_427650 [compost metagenome]